MLALFFLGEFLLHMPVYFIFFFFLSFFIRGVSLTHPVLASFLSGESPLHIFLFGEFLLHSLSWLILSLNYYFFMGSLDFFNFFLWGVSLAHSVQA